MLILLYPLTSLKTFLSKKKQVTLDQNDIDVFWIRTDPPFDESYLMDTYLLSIGGEWSSCAKFAKGPSKLAGKSLVSTLSRYYCPKSLITRNINEYKEFTHEMNQFIVKPLDGYGGSSVFLLSQESKNKNVAFETLSAVSSRYVLVQEYLSAAQTGDKRILLLNGEPLGAVLRVHSEDDHRNNFAAGGNAVADSISAQDMKIIQQIKPMLFKEDIFFAGIDIIGDKLVEVNVTSPTCLREMERLDKQNYARQIILAAEDKWRSRP